MLEIVKHLEKDNIITIGLTVKGEYSSGKEHRKNFIKNNIKKEHCSVGKEKVTHRFFQKKLSNGTCVDMKATNQWLMSNMSSHVEGYLMSMQEQKINTKDALKGKEKYPEEKQIMSNTCRLCKKSVKHYFTSPQAAVTFHQAYT